MDFQKAIEFIHNHANGIERARLNYILSNQRPSQQVVEHFIAGQQSDGGWPAFWSQGHSSLDATCFRLAQAEQLGILDSEPAIGRAVDYLTQCQSPDGSWEEDGQIASAAPPWLRSGDLAARLYLTANCGLWLALLGNSEDKACRAAASLQAHLEPDGHLPSYLHAHWLAGGLFHALARPVSMLIFDYLNMRIEDLATSNLSWLITTLRAAAVPAAHPLMVRAASLLEEAQQEDGSWQSEDGSSQNVHSTLEALRALSLCGRAIG